MILKKYLHTEEVAYEKILEKSGYSENQLAHLKVIEYPEELIWFVSQAVGKSESIVWYELLKLENNQNIIRINDSKEFVEAVDAQKAFIYIPEPIRQEQQSLINSVLTEKDRLGFELGSRGTGNLLAEIFYQIGRSLGKESSEFKRIKSKLRHYYVKVHDKEGSLLYEKEQTY